MFLLPLGVLSGADLGLADVFLTNLAPVVVGNAIGAGLFVGCMQWFALGSPKMRRR
jgi:formate/nitrite transporter FocA (FNT family)